MATQAWKHLDRLAGWLLPPRCVLCGMPGGAARLDLCAPCRAALPLPDGDAPPSPLTRLVVGFAYEPPVDWMVQALKYRGDLAVGRVLGTLLAQRVAERASPADIDLILPLPLHPKRLAERGFNQSQELARWVARELGRPLEPRLAWRSRTARPQVGLPASEREANVRGVFEVALGVAGLRLAIVDDVLTTGSTVGELARCLLAAGAASAEAWCAARASRGP